MPPSESSHQTHRRTRCCGSLRLPNGTQSSGRHRAGTACSKTVPTVRTHKPTEQRNHRALTQTATGKAEIVHTMSPVRTTRPSTVVHCPHQALQNPAKLPCHKASVVPVLLIGRFLVFCLFQFGPFQTSSIGLLFLH